LNKKSLRIDDPDAVVVNEAGFKKLASGEKRKAGIVQNFGRLFNQPEIPLKIKAAQLSEYNFLCIRVLEVDIRKTMHQVARYLNADFASISFLDRGFSQWLSYENRLNALSEILAMVSALLSCCAIYGLSISLARDKAKQIAIHKISGASTRHIIILLIHQFLKPVALALFFFGPLSFLFITEWLRRFVYATSVGVSDLLIALGYCFAIVFLTCSYQALKLERVSLSTALK
jgi:hypothetical protein